MSDIDLSEELERELAGTYIDKYDQPSKPTPTKTVISHDEKYDALAGVLQDAYDQAATGKGRHRHANGKPFDRQPIMEIGRMVGIGYPAGQAQKKAQEAAGMFRRGEGDAAVAELLGAINYLAAAVMLIRETKPGA